MHFLIFYLASEIGNIIKTTREWVAPPRLHLRSDPCHVHLSEEKRKIRMFVYFPLELSWAEQSRACSCLIHCVLDSFELRTLKMISCACYCCYNNSICFANYICYFTVLFFISSAKFLYLFLSKSVVYPNLKWS